MTAPIVPPSGTASCRQPRTMPRFSGGNSRSSELIPATGTAAEPTPARNTPPANAQAFDVDAAAR